MRRAQSIFAMLLLLAMPLAILADAADRASGTCNRYCCLPHGRHGASASQASAQKSDESMPCHHSAGKMTNCSMRCGGRVLDVGVFAPLPPTKPATALALLPPDATRARATYAIQGTSSGHLAEPFQPPRA